jgi:hypothetical protein
VASGQQVSTATGQAARDWRALRASGDLQFSPVLPKPPEPQHLPPQWLQWLGRLLDDIFAPLARLLGVALPVVEWLVIGAAGLVAVWLVFRFIKDRLQKRRVRPTSEPEWTPDRAEALALLGDADRLAAEGRYDEAAHLLLRRSVQQILAVHPEWLHPASTAREIAALSFLPAPARSAFAVIADRVEASRYALRALLAADWQAARDAYARFALARLDGAA